MPPESPAFLPAYTSTQEDERRLIQQFEQEQEHLEAEANAHKLHSLDRGVVFRLSIISFYFVGAVVMLAWALRGPTVPQEGRVFRTGNLIVDQFYSGLALSTILAPAAIITRMLSNDLQFLHPFSIASTKAVAIRDFDRMTDFGWFASLATFKYSVWLGFVQVFTMMVGAVFVPLGTLIITTGSYGPSTLGTAVVGLPIVDPRFESLHHGMAYQADTAQPSFNSSDLFFSMVSDTFKGDVISRTTSLTMIPGLLGPIQTVNITFTPEVRYNGILTFEWAGNCKQATDSDIPYTISLTEDDMLYINVTFAGGVQDGTVVGWRPILGWISTDTWTPSGVPLGGTHYLLQASTKNLTSSLSLASNETDTVEYDPAGVWLSRVKCTPTFNWQVSSCVFDGKSMTDCVPLPGGNTTELDTVGLDVLDLYYSAVLFEVYATGNYVLNITVQPSYVSTKLEAYDEMYGIIARSMVSILTGGYFGTASVPTIGSPSERVYIARIPILVTFVVLLFILIAIVVADIVRSLAHHLPFRKLSFLTIASAVRGYWWDKEFSHSGALTTVEMRKRHHTKVMFGLDEHGLGRIGLAPNVSMVRKRSRSAAIDLL